MKTALITGITGQDGSYLAEFLLGKGYQVFGMERVSAARNYWRIEHLFENEHFRLVQGDLLDSRSLLDVLRKAQPDEVYNLAAQSHVARSFDQPIGTADITGLGAARMLDNVYLFGEQARHAIRYYQASSSEMFGKVGDHVPQDETTPFNPANPYAAAKVYAHYMVGIYRRSYGMFAVAGILFNHESPRRGELFITRKVAYGAACCKLGIEDSPRLSENNAPIVKNGELALGNLNAIRDWGYAGDYVEAMWLMLQQNKPRDYVIATGDGRTIRELCQTAFAYVGLDWNNFVVVNKDFVRPSETGPLVGNPQRAYQELGWRRETSFEELVGMMVNAELASLR